MEDTKSRDERYKRITERVTELTNEVKRQCIELSTEEFLSEERMKERDEIHKEVMRLIRSI